MKGQPKPMKMTQYTGNLSAGTKMPKKMPIKGKMGGKKGGGKKGGCSCGH